MKGLTPGRIVHYVAYNGTPLAALMMGCWDEEHGTVNLAVFTDMPNVNGLLNFGLQFHREVEYSEEPKPGTWHWVFPGQDTNRYNPTEQNARRESGWRPGQE